MMSLLEFSAQAIRDLYRERGMNVSFERCAHVDTKKIREAFGLSQTELARFFNPGEPKGTGLSTIKAWDQGRRRPCKTAQIIFLIIKRKAIEKGTYPGDEDDNNH